MRNFLCFTTTPADGPHVDLAVATMQVDGVGILAEGDHPPGDGCRIGHALPPQPGDLQGVGESELVLPLAWRQVALDDHVDALDDESVRVILEGENALQPQDVGTVGLGHIADPTHEHVRVQFAA